MKRSQRSNEEWQTMRDRLHLALPVVRVARQDLMKKAKWLPTFLHRCLASLHRLLISPGSKRRMLLDVPRYPHHLPNHSNQWAVELDMPGRRRCRGMYKDQGDIQWGLCLVDLGCHHNR